MPEEIVTGSKSRGFAVRMMCIGDTPLNTYLCQNPISGMVEILRPTPKGSAELVNAFKSDRAAWAWAADQYRQGKLPLA